MSLLIFKSVLGMLSLRFHHVVVILLVYLFEVVYRRNLKDNFRKVMKPLMIIVPIIVMLSILLIKVGIKN